MLLQGETGVERPLCEEMADGLIRPGADSRCFDEIVIQMTALRLNLPDRICVQTRNFRNPKKLTSANETNVISVCEASRFVSMSSIAAAASGTENKCARSPLELVGTDNALHIHR